MPNEFTTPVSPFTAYTTKKIVATYDFPSTVVSIPANGIIEGVIAEPVASGLSSAFIVLHYSTSTVDGTSLVGKYGSAKTLNSNFSNTNIARYIGGYLKATTTGPNITCEARMYNTNANNSNASNWANLSTTAFPITEKPVDNNGVILSSAPCHLNTLTLSKIDSAMYPPSRIHFRINNKGTVATNVTLSGTWWVEYYSGTGTTLPYTQDTKCPQVLAENLLGMLRNQYFCYSVSENLFTGLDAIIQDKLNTLLQSWVAFNDILPTIPVEPKKPPTEAEITAEWKKKKKIRKL